jgi:hypothetical protein
MHSTSAPQGSEVTPAGEERAKLMFDGFCAPLEIKAKLDER